MIAQQYTNTVLDEFLAIVRDGYEGKKAAAFLGLNYDSVLRILHQRGIYIGRQPKAFYVIYDEDDDLFTCGTAEQCANVMGITLASFYSAVTRREKRKRYTIFKVEDEDE